MNDAYNNNHKALLLLNSIDGLGIRRKNRLLESIDFPADLVERLNEYKADFIRICGLEIVEKFERLNKSDAYDRILEELYKAGVSVICRADSGWAETLNDIDEPPLLFYAKGDISLIKSRCISVVGTRSPSRYGINVTRDFVSEFARAGLTIVSGFARGIDSTAHKMAVELEKPTIAVLANGLDICYPAENRSLGQRILETSGLMLSEYGLKTTPTTYNFPERNRIIAALSEGLFVPEMAKKSGSMITVNHALDQGKNIYVVPSNINSPSGEGTNALIKSMQGCIVTSPEDILTDLRISFESTSKPAYQLSIIEQLIMEELKMGETHLEQLIVATKLSINELNGVLLDMEMNDLIGKTTGNYYIIK